MSVIKKGKG